MDDDLVLASFSTSSPAMAALAWVNAVRQGRFSSVWAAMTSDFRLVCVQDWIVKNPAVMFDPLVTGSRDELAIELAQPSPEHRLWVHAGRVAERMIRTVTTDVVGDRELGYGARPRPLGVDLELVRLIPLDQLKTDDSGLHQWQPGQVVQNLMLLMQSGDGGWRVAGAGGWLPRPGWPPQFEPIAGPSD